MQRTDSSTFFLSILEKDGRVSGHAYSNYPLEANEVSTPEGSDAIEDVTDSWQNAISFNDVFFSFISIVETYRRFLSLALTIAPQISQSVSVRTVQSFAKSRGVERPDLKKDGVTVYEMSINLYPDFAHMNEQIIAANAGARELPNVMIIGLISSYDAFLSRLLKVIFTKYPDMVLTKGKEVPYADIFAFSSIDEVRSHLIDKEVESIIRESHVEHFRLIENKFDMKLRVGLDVWPSFVELCERRNLLTHTGGVVSRQYLKVCNEHKCQIDGVSLGEKLKVSHKYYASSVRIVYEIGFKLASVLWRKFDPDDRGAADGAFNQATLNLIKMREYELAEGLIKFALNTFKTFSSDSVRRMMCVNLANSLRLQGRRDEAKGILSKEDWSATSDTFRLCVSAVQEDVENVLLYMKRIGSQGYPTKDDYKWWPVFRGMRRNPAFASAYFDVFGETLLPLQKSVQVEGANSDGGAIGLDLGGVED